MNKTLNLAMSKASKLPPETQEKLGREILERIDSLEALRKEIEIGLKELDVGKGEPLDLETLIGELRAEHGRGD
jgi:hypothetical protein